MNKSLLEKLGVSMIGISQPKKFWKISIKRWSSKDYIKILLLEVYQRLVLQTLQMWSFNIKWRYWSYIWLGTREINQNKNKTKDQVKPRIFYSFERIIFPQILHDFHLVTNSTSIIFCVNMCSSIKSQICILIRTPFMIS